MNAFVIDHQCPQCGAPANLEETDRLFTCAYCRVKSLLLTRDFFRYVLPAKTPAGRDLIYLPYWRFKGTLLFSRPDGNDHKFIDVNQCAVPSAGLPITLGLRAQAMKLKFLAPDMKGRFIPPAHSFSETFTAYQKRFCRTLPQPILCSAHLGESMGLLYAPFYAKDRLYDAVLDKPLGEIPEGFPAAGVNRESPGWGVDFVPALCPDCGWDLEGQRDAWVLHCRNCSAAWYPAGGKLARVESLGLADAETGLLHLPFWQVTCAVSGIALETYADLIRTANLPRLIQPSLAGRPFCFWAPAFKLRAQAYIRLAESLTLTQVPERLAPALPPEPHYPVTLPVEEACESLKVVLAGFFKPRVRIADILPAIAIKPTGFRLAYLPFAEDRHDYIQPLTRLAVNKNLLNLSKNL